MGVSQIHFPTPEDPGYRSRLLRSAARQDLSYTHPMLAAHLSRFYTAIAQLAAKSTLSLNACDGRLMWPARGVYFFFENGENRGNGEPRVVRVGTHAVSAGSKTTLWDRLSQHRGTQAGLGNHRGSIFRVHVGGALITRHADELPQVVSWKSPKRPAAQEAREAEDSVERLVSACVRKMPFTYVEINDEPSRKSQRSVIERNSIALMAAAVRAGIDCPSDGWLGRSCPHPAVQRSGLWNVKHVDDQYDPAFLDLLETLASKR